MKDSRHSRLNRFRFGHCCRRGGRRRAATDTHQIVAQGFDLQIFLATENVVRTALAGQQQQGPVGVCIRAEEVRLDGASTPSDNLLRGSVQALYHEGPIVRVGLDCGVPLVALLTAPVARAMNLRQGDQFTVRIAPAAVHLVPGE